MELLERGELSPEEYAWFLSGLDDEAIAAVDRLTDVLMRFPPRYVAGCLAGGLLSSSGGDEVEARKQVRKMKRFFDAAMRRAGGA